MSLLLVLHLAAVIIPPYWHATFGSPVARKLSDSFLGEYFEAAFLNHGYAFFSPDPPLANYLIRYRLEFDDGRPPLERTFPDLDRHRPRLLYHRHFMLTSQINDEIQAESPFAKPKWESFKRHLKSKYGASRVTLVLVEHRVPTPNDFSEGMHLRDPRLYTDLIVPSMEPEVAEELQ